MLQALGPVDPCEPAIERTEGCALNTQALMVEEHFDSQGYLPRRSIVEGVEHPHYLCQYEVQDPYAWRNERLRNRTCSGPSRTTSRTRTFVSTACMLFANVLPDAIVSGQLGRFHQIPLSDRRSAARSRVAVRVVVSAGGTAFQSNQWHMMDLDFNLASHYISISYAFLFA
jgi:hypothetical protein